MHDDKIEDYEKLSDDSCLTKQDKKEISDFISDNLTDVAENLVTIEVIKSYDKSGSVKVLLKF